MTLAQDARNRAIYELRRPILRVAVEVGETPLGGSVRLHMVGDVLMIAKTHFGIGDGQTVQLTALYWSWSWTGEQIQWAGTLGVRESSDEWGKIKLVPTQQFPADIPPGPLASYCRQQLAEFPQRLGFPIWGMGDEEDYASAFLSNKSGLVHPGFTVRSPLLVRPLSVLQYRLTQRREQERTAEFDLSVDRRTIDQFVGTLSEVLLSPELAALDPVRSYRLLELTP